MIQVSSWLSDPKLLVALFATYIGFQGFRNKRGVEVRGSYTITGSMACEDLYISSINLENQKDRAVTIYAIYMRIGRACYVTVKEFSDQPLILKAFESYSEEYGPLEFYMANSNRLSIDSSFNNDKIEKSLYISTASGKRKVKKPAKRWTPLTEASKNSCTVIAHPVRGSLKGKSFGSEAKYLIELVREEEEDLLLIAHSYDYKIQRFRDFQLTQDSLQSADKLQQFIESLIEEGSIDAKSVVVHSLDTWREENLKFYYPHGEIKVPKPNWVEFFVTNRLRTLRVNRRTARSLKKQIKEIEKQRSQQTEVPQTSASD